MEDTQKEQNPVDPTITEAVLANQDLKKDESKNQTAENTVKRMDPKVEEEEPMRAFGEKAFEEMTVEELGKESRILRSLLLNKDKKVAQLALEKMRHIDTILKERKAKKEQPPSQASNPAEAPANQPLLPPVPPQIAITLPNTVTEQTENRVQPAQPKVQMTEREEVYEDSNLDTPEEEEIVEPPPQTPPPNAPKTRREPPRPKKGAKKPKPEFSIQEPPGKEEFSKYPKNPKICGQYEVECILDQRKIGSKWFYLTYWAGKFAKPEFVTWEPSTHFSDTTILSLNSDKREKLLEECTAWCVKHSKKNFLQGPPGEEEKKPEVETKKDFETGFEDLDK